MDLKKFSQEIQNFIEEAENSRNQKGFLNFETCQRILEYAAETNSDALFGLGYYRFAEFYWNKRDVEQTLHCLEECIKCFRNVNMKDYLARAYNMMGVASSKCGNRLVALSYYYIGMKYAEESEDIYAQAMINSNTAYIFMRMKHYKEAKDRCNLSIHYFKRAEETIFRERNLVWSMIRCGFCHLLLEEPKEALNLWEQIQEVMTNSPQEKEQRVILQAYEAACEITRGKKEHAMQLIEELRDLFYRERDLQPIEDMIIPIADLMDRFHYKDLLETLIKIFDENKSDENSELYLDMYPYKSRLLLEKDKIEEYVEYSKEYLEWYQRHLEAGRMVTGRILEMQHKLSSVEAERQAMHEYNQKLEEIALYDSLTSLPNRAYLNDYLTKEFERAHEDKTLYGVELLDIDRFKEYNDTYGHLQGDVCLEAVANVLRDMERENVFCARYGGDEFMIIYTGMTESEIREIVETIQRKVRALDILQEETGKITKVTVSQGVFNRIPKAQNREWDFNLMADIMLYQAKQGGKNTYRIATEFQ